MHSIHFLLLFTHISTILLYYVPPHFRRQANITILELPLTPLYVYSLVTAHLHLIHADGSAIESLAQVIHYKVSYIALITDFSYVVRTPRHGRPSWASMILHISFY